MGTSGTDVLETLRDPPRDVCVQVFIWHIPSIEEVSPRLVDAFGLGLEFRPPFFQGAVSLGEGANLSRRTCLGMRLNYGFCD